MSYSKNFGIRSFENIVRDGRQRTPAASAIVIGEPVLVDPATPGSLKQATAGAAADQSAGLAVYEHIQVTGVDPATYGQGDFDTIPANRYAQIVRGPGAKVWFKNTALGAKYDGTVVPAAGLLADSIDVGVLAIGAELTPDGAGKFKVGNGTTDGVWLIVEQVNASTGVVEARLTF